MDWVTESEIENLGFILERKEQNSKEWQEIASYIAYQELRGQGNTSSRTEYSYVDMKAEFDKIYDYRLTDVSYDGKKQIYKKILSGITLSKLLCETSQSPINTLNTVSFSIQSQKIVVPSVKL